MDERFASRPHLRRRLLMIADLIDQAVAEGCTAHEAEERAIEQIRKLGQEVLTDWAEKVEPEARKRAQAENPKLINYGKKNAKLAFDVRKDLCSRTVFAPGPSGRAGASVLWAGSDLAAGLLSATTKGLGGFRSGRFFSGGDQKSARTLWGGGSR